MTYYDCSTFVETGVFFSIVEMSNAEARRILAKRNQWRIDTVRNQLRNARDSLNGYMNRLASVCACIPSQSIRSLQGVSQKEGKRFFF